MLKKVYTACKTTCIDSYEELVHKTTWPSRTELMNSAVVVLIASLVIAAVIFCFDWISQNVMELIYGFIGQF